MSLDTFEEDFENYKEDVKHYLNKEKDFEEEDSKYKHDIVRNRYLVVMIINGMVQHFYSTSSSKDGAIRNVYHCCPKISDLSNKVISVQESDDVTDEDRSVYNQVKSAGFSLIGIDKENRYVFVSENTTVKFTASNYSDALKSIIRMG